MPRLPFAMFLLSLTALSATASEPRPLPQVTEALRELVADGDARAIALGVFEDGQTGFTGIGRMGPEDDTAPDRATVFEIGSISKVFTALLAQVQVEAGRLDWDGPIGGYLPEVKFASPEVAAITLRSLATHESGLPRLPDNMRMEDPLDPYAGYEREDLFTFLAGFDPESLDRSYEYSNLGVGLLGELAAMAAGLDYGEAMVRDVLEPLGMEDTGTGTRPGWDGRIARGYSDGANMPLWSGFDALAGAGALMSTTGDLFRFIEANLARETLGPALSAIATPQENGTTGLGWHYQADEDGQLTWWHNGGTGGYSSFLAFRQDSRTGVVILATTTDNMAITELGMMQITGTGRPATDTDFSAYTGSYELAPGFVLSVYEDGDRLFGQATGQAAFPLTEAGEHRFSFAAAGIQITFEDAEPGPAPRLTMVQAGRTTRAPRVDDTRGIARPETIDVDPAELAAYEGEYVLAPGVLITVEARDDQLFAQLTGQQSFPVFPFEKDKFFYKVVDARLIFERDASGAVIAVVLDQAGEKRAPRR